MPGGIRACVHVVCTKIGVLPGRQAGKHAACHALAVVPGQLRRWMRLPPPWQQIQAAGGREVQLMGFGDGRHEKRGRGVSKGDECRQRGIIAMRASQRKLAYTFIPGREDKAAEMHWRAQNPRGWDSNETAGQCSMGQCGTPPLHSSAASTRSTTMAEAPPPPACGRCRRRRKHGQRVHGGSGHAVAGAGGVTIACR